MMNSNGILCLRYIDDFLILGPNRKAVKKAFKQAKEYLTSINMEIYDPFTDNEKGQLGDVSEGIDFLGCIIKPDRISPSGKSVARLKKKITDHFSTATNLLKKPDELPGKNLSMVKTLNHVNNLIKGWGNQYFFCNNHHQMKSIDTFASEEINKYLKTALTTYSSLDKKNQKRLLGVQLLTDCKQDPIVGRELDEDS